MDMIRIINKIALISVVLLIYWVFAYISSTFFDFKVFREHMVEIFLFNLLGIFAVLFGAIILNVMFNLTAVAEWHSKRERNPQTVSKIKLALFIGSFAALFALLYAGDRATLDQQEDELVAVVTALVEEQNNTLEELTDYVFSNEYVEKAIQNVKLLGKVEEQFPKVTVIVREEIEGKNFFLGFSDDSIMVGNHELTGADDQELSKADYILSTSPKRGNTCIPCSKENVRIIIFRATKIITKSIIRSLRTTEKSCCGCFAIPNICEKTGCDQRQASEPSALGKSIGRSVVRSPPEKNRRAPFLPPD